MVRCTVVYSDKKKAQKGSLKGILALSFWGANDPVSRLAVWDPLISTMTEITHRGLKATKVLNGFKSHSQYHARALALPPCIRRMLPQVRTSRIPTNTSFDPTIWGFPKIGVPLNHPFWGEPPIYGNPHMPLFNSTHWFVAQVWSLCGRYRLAALVPGRRWNRGVSCLVAGVYTPISKYVHLQYNK